MTTDLGRDTSATTGLRSGRYVTGARLVAEAAYRRLTTPRGTLRGGEEEQRYGFDITGLVGSCKSDSAAAAIGGQIKSELKKDERIESLTVDVLRVTNGPLVTLTINIEAVTGAGPFTLKLGVSEVTTEILGLEAAA